MKFLMACFFSTLSLAGCSEAAKPVALSITGYNYTGRYIATFSVNKQWGGNLYDDSGGGSVCCLSFKPTSQLPFNVEVEWELNEKRDFVKNEWIPAPEEHHRATVAVIGPLPKNKPSHLEVHFMPDGSVQAYVTHFASDPFLLRNGKPNPDIRFAPPGDEILAKH